MKIKTIGLFTIIASMLWFTSCNTHEEELKQLQQQQDSLKKVLTEKDSVVDEFFSAFNEIQENLNTIKQKENIINVDATNFENTPEVKDQINKDIQTIYDLLQANKDKLKRLQRRMHSAGIKIKSLQKTIASLEKQLQAKDVEIADLKKKLEALNIQINVLETNVDSLSIENAKKEQTINTQDQQLHTAYYVIGSKKELLEKKIITKTGGFVGIGRIVKLQEELNTSYFTTIDIREMKEIPILAKKAQIVTSHPKSSYELVTKDGKVEKLIIKDPEKFWSISKYLVIMVKQ